MQYAICLQPYIPMRLSASEQSEMISQLLFGDTFRVLREEPRWYYVQRDCDDYEGWVDWKTVTLITETDYRRYQLQTEQAPLLRQPYNPIQKTIDGVPSGAHLSWGSRIFDLDETGVFFRIEGIRYEVDSTSLIPPVKAQAMSRRACSKFLLQQANLLLNVPYLWGGCSAFGLDCSGFIQTLFRFVGIALPRDASKQATLGTKVTIETCQEGDLAFFGKDGRISHVGLVADNNRILHVSGSLHYDELRPEGIWSAERGEMTHKLIEIRNFF